MNGLTVRWSLEGAAEGVEHQLAEYVEVTSHARWPTTARIPTTTDGIVGMETIGENDR